MDGSHGELATKILNLAMKAGAEQAESFISRNRVTTIRMATNEVLEAKNITVEGAGLRVVKSKSIGFASTTDLTEPGIKRLVGDSYRIARSKKPDPDFKSLPEPVKLPGLVDGYDSAIVKLGLDEAVEYGKTVVGTALDVDPKLDVSGAINFVVEECAVKNSLGVDDSDVNTFIFSSITVERGEDWSSGAQSCARRLRDFKPGLASKQAAESAAIKQAPIAVEAGNYDVVLSPRSLTEVGDFVLSYAFDLSAVDQGISYFKGRLGEEVAEDEFSISDDGRHPDGIATKKIDDEGMPTRRTPLIKDGVLRSYITDSYYANKLTSPVKSLTPTGNGFRFNTIPGRDYSRVPQISSTNLVIDPGDYTLDEMVRETKRGILVGRIWYTYPISPTIGEFSTTNRGDSFLIENGEITKPILPNSFRINDNIQKLLRNLKGLSKEQVQSVVWGGQTACVAPYAKFGDVNITYSKT